MYAPAFPARSADGASHDVSQPLGGLLRTLGCIGLDHDANQGLGPTRPKQYASVIAQEPFFFSHSRTYCWRVDTHPVDSVDIQQHLRIPLHDRSEVSQCLS
jgi:hypothetical protein